MEALGCLAVLLCIAPLVLVISAFARIREIQREIAQLKRSAAVPSPAPSHAPASATGVPAPAIPKVIRSAPPQPAQPPPLIIREPVAPPGEAVPDRAARTKEPPADVRPVNWESLFGVKIFAWIGGLAFFLGVVFLVKYSFENNLITPTMRIVIGAAIGVAAIAAGWFTSQRGYRVPGQSLCATGVVILYADIFGAHSFYNLLSLGIAFALMCIVTLGAFLLAVTLNAQVVVILGLLGGFLTPLLLPTGHDQPLRVFSYIALLDVGIGAVALRKRWNYLFVLAAVGTVAMQLPWAIDFRPRDSSAALAIFVGFEALFVLFACARGKTQSSEHWSLAAACITAASALAFGFYLLDFDSIGTRPSYFFGFVFLADGALLALALTRKDPARLAGPAGTVVFFLLATWTSQYLRHDLLWWALGAYFLFALGHAAFSIWPQRESKRTPALLWEMCVPLLALVLLLIAVARGETTFALWSCVLLVNVIALGLAMTSRALVALVVALIVTLITVGLWIATAPPLGENVVSTLVVVAGFGVFFSGAATVLARKLGVGNNDPRAHLPVFAAALPFVLLLMVIEKLPLGAPTAVFVVALLLAVLLLALGIFSGTSWIAAVALLSTWAVEAAWHSLHFANQHALIAVGWYSLFLLLFVGYPFFARDQRAWLPWAIGAMSGVLHFALIYELVTSAYPTLRNGALPAFFVVPFAFGVWYLVARRNVVAASGDARLAWQAGAALLFVSLIFPIQFEREWITIGWALEGLALLGLFRRVPNAGLRLVGAVVLAIAFARLALNPVVFEYHKRTPTRVWNWYLYAYSLTSFCLLAGAYVVRKFTDTSVARAIPRLLYTLGAILVFLLLNIEIADYFSIGPTLTFAFYGDFARDMTYSIAWAVFALALLLIGIFRTVRAVRIAAIALLCVTLAKLFLHDLDQLSQLYRIGAFLSVAVIAIITSFLYHRFLVPAARQPSPPA